MYIFNLTVNPELQSLQIEDEDIKLKVKNHLTKIVLQLAYDEYFDSISILSVDGKLVVPATTSNLILDLPSYTITEL